MKLLTTLAAAAAVCVTLVPEDANAQRRGGYWVGGYTVRAPLYRTYAAYRPYRAYGYAAYRPYWGGYGYAAYRPYWGGYRYAAYRPYWGWGVGAAYASAAYTTVAWSPYYSYAAYGYYPAAYSYASCGYAWSC